MPTDGNKQPAGHPISFREIEGADVAGHGDLMEQIFRAEITGVVVHDALPQSLVERGLELLASDSLASAWCSPNAGMPGGEIRTIGDAATPTYTAFGGPTAERYTASTVTHAEVTETIFSDAKPTPHIRRILSGLFGGKPAGPSTFKDGTKWLPFNYRALDPGVQIYSHHDNHYGLQIYEDFDTELDRSRLLSWFITLQPAEQDGDLIVYGLWGSDPNPPMLPTRFLDTAALERDYLRKVVELRAGDMVIFDAGRHVHRVSPVGGARPRVTLGGFLTTDQAGSRVAFWS